MDSRLKQRLIGAAVLIALAVIFLPMLVKGPAPDGGVSDLALDVPDAPAAGRTIDVPLYVESSPVPALDQAGAMDASTQGQSMPADAPSAADGAAAAEPDTDTALPASVAGGQYVVHYATFATQPEADEMVRQLQARALPAFTRPVVFNGRPAVAVRIGPYGQRAEAETVRVRASQVRGDVKPLVLALDADDASAGPHAAASGGAGSAPGVSAPSTPPATAAVPSRSPATVAAVPSRPAAPERSASPPARQRQPSNGRASAASAAATGFVVQVGAFSNAASANTLQRRLRAANIPAFTDAVNTSRGRLTRVNAGPVSSRAEADQLKTRVKTAIGTDGIVRSHP